MLVKDLRKTLEKYDKKEMTDIVVELYKRLPKKVKEDYDIDKFIEDINNKTKKEDKKISFDDLCSEMRYFLDCAKAGYYSSPNKVVPKKERSNWRFKAKRYYKELTKTIPTTDIGVKSTKLLIELYELVSRGTNTLVFTNWDTFRALGVSQTEYFDMLLKRILSTGESINNIKVCIDLLDNCKDPDILDEFLINIFIDNLRTEDSKLVAINLLDEKVVEVNDKIKNLDKRHKYNYEYKLKSDNNLYTETITRLYFSSFEVDEGIKYYQKNYIHYDSEVKEYILLEILKELELYEDWITEYERASKKIKLREELTKDYKKIKELV